MNQEAMEGVSHDLGARNARRLLARARRSAGRPGAPRLDPAQEPARPACPTPPRESHHRDAQRSRGPLARQERPQAGRLLARKHGVGNQRWLMGYYQEPEDLSEITDIARLYDELGVESLFAWTYRGGHGTVLAAPRALELWDSVGEAFGSVLHR